jgi:hypothetical protein
MNLWMTSRNRYSSGAQMVSWLFEVQANPKYNWKTEFPGMTIKGGVLMSGGTSYPLRHARSRHARQYAAFELCALPPPTLRFFACMIQGHTSATQTRTIQVTQHSQSGAAKDAPHHRPDSALLKMRTVSTLRSAARAILMWSLT